MTKKLDAKTRFIQAAEIEFLANGYEGATVRKITSRAKTSPATLHRLWGSKKLLFAEIFKHSFEPVRGPQLLLFTSLVENQKAGKTVTIRNIIRAFMDPFLHLAASKEKSIQRGLEVYCRAVTDPSPEAREVFNEVANDNIYTFFALLKTCLPKLSDEKFFLTLCCIFGCHIYPLAFGRRLSPYVNFEFDSINWDNAADQIISFLQAGLTATTQLEN